MKEDNFFLLHIISFNSIYIEQLVMNNKDKDISFLKLKVPHDHMKKIISIQKGYKSLIDMNTVSLDEPPLENFKSENKILIEMERKSEYNPSMCCHLKMKNKSEKPIIVYIKSPNNRCFYVTPKVDQLDAKSEKLFFFCFAARSSSIPNDLSVAYTIYHMEINNSKLIEALKRERETHSRRLIRHTWSQYSNRSSPFLLWLPVIFNDKPTKGRSCSKRHADYLPKLIFDAKGHKMKEEEVYNPLKHDEDDENLPSAEEDSKKN